MGATSRLTRLDAFSKTVDDARIRTTTGGLITLTSLCTILFLIFSEYRDYRRVTILPSLTVDKSRGAQLPINLNITFPHVPCNLLTLDIMDISGVQQVGITHGVHLTRLTRYPESRPLSRKQLDVHSAEDVAKHLDPKYCGPCYGATSLREGGCCNTCDDVREAYQSNGWAWGDGSGVEQCEKEHYAEHLAEMREEGCNIEGHISVNKVAGNFHIAPGKSFSNANMHVHDLVQYYSSSKEHSFTHFIHKLSFGPDLQLGEEVAKNPLDGATQFTAHRAFNFMYFIKVVSTSFVPLGVENGEPGTVETHQYSVTSHTRHLGGGKDKEHEGAVQARGGIPGVFFSYDISPMKVVNREVRLKGFVSFLTGVCAVIGGTLTVAAALDRGVYEGGLRVKKMHQG